MCTLFCQNPGLVDQLIYSGRTGDTAIKMTIKALQDQRYKMVKAADITLQNRNNIDSAGSLFLLSCRDPVGCCVLLGFVVAVVALQMHWGMLREVLSDCTGSYILSQLCITLILASVLKVCIYCKVLSWLHHEGL